MLDYFDPMSEGLVSDEDWDWYIEARYVDPAEIDWDEPL